MLKIWGRATSSNVQKVLWTCAELDIAFERVDWGGPFGGNQDPAYLAMNPTGLVPTVQDGACIIWESNTIIRYLCATRGGAHLHPSDPARRSEVERWMDWQIASLAQPMGALHMGYYRTPPERRDPKALEAARSRSLELWSMVERQLEAGPYIAGADFTLADIALGMFGYRWHVYPIERPSLPRLEAWYQRVADRPGFKAHIARPLE
jgi:glutathione S-transferase